MLLIETRSGVIVKSRRNGMSCVSLRREHPLCTGKRPRGPLYNTAFTDNNTALTPKCLLRSHSISQPQ